MIFAAAGVMLPDPPEGKKWTLQPGTAVQDAANDEQTLRLAARIEHLVVAGLLTGSTVLLYDGNPGYPDMNVLWEFAEKTGMTCFGTSASYLMGCAKAEMEPGRTWRLTKVTRPGSSAPSVGSTSVHQQQQRALMEECSMEWIKDLSDKLIIWMLRVTSGFAKELTQDGLKEQALWREQRLRNLRGLALRSRQRFSEHDKSA